MHPTLLLIRPAAASDRLGQRVAGAKVRLIVSPLIEIVECDPGPMPPDLTGLVLTSANAAVAAGRIAGLQGSAAWCVGDRTARAALKAGFAAESADGDADALVAAVIAARPEGTLVHLRGEHSRGQVAERLRDAGIDCTERVIYRQEARGLSAAAREALVGDGDVIVPIYSPRTAQLFVESGEFSAAIHIVAMSQAVAEIAETIAPASIEIAPEPRGLAMEQTILRKIAAIGPAPLEGPGGTH